MNKPGLVIFVFALVAVLAGSMLKQCGEEKPAATGQKAAPQ